jgi:5-methylcytosine-specific restriction enzyme A
MVRDGGRAQGGPDHPEQMIALCPNCHAIKTRGRTREQLRQELFTVAPLVSRLWLHRFSWGLGVGES